MTNRYLLNTACKNILLSMLLFISIFAAGQLIQINGAVILIYLLAAILAVLTFKRIKIGITTLLFLVPFSTVSLITHFASYNLPIGFNEYTIVFYVVCFQIIATFIFKKRKFILPPFSKLLIFYSIIVAIAAFRSFLDSNSLQYLDITVITNGFLKSISYLLFYYIAFYNTKNESQREFYLRIIKIAVLVMILLFYLESTGLLKLGLMGPSTYTGSLITLQNMLEYTNFIAGVVALYIPLILPVAFYGTKKSRAVVWLIYILSWITVLISGGRAGALGLSVSSIIGIIYFSKMKFWKKIFIIILIVGVLISLLMFMVELKSFWMNIIVNLQSKNYDYLTMGRMTIWKNVLNYLKDPVHLLFGGGIDDFRVRTVLFGFTSVRSVESLYLKTLADTGILGLLVVIAIFVNIVKFVQTRDHFTTSDYNIFSTGILLSTISLFFYNFAQGSTISSPIMAVFWFYLGMCVNASSSRNNYFSRR